MDKVLQIRWKTFVVSSPHQNVLTCVDYGISLIKCEGAQEKGPIVSKNGI